MGLQNCRDGNNPYDMIRHFSSLLDTTQNRTHHMTMYNGTREFFKYKSRNKMDLSDEQLLAMELCIYQGINYQVEGRDGEHISQI